MKRTILVALLSLSVCTSLATGRTIYVDDDGPADYNNIQAAIDDANDDDTVVVADGLYKGEGNRDIDFKGKSIKVQSENGPENCIIDCENSGRGFNFHSWEDKSSVLAGFTITRGNADDGGGIYNINSSPTITECIISGNTAETCGGGIYSMDSSPTIANCIITGNTARNSGGGIYNYNSSSTLTNCTFSGNSATNYGGGIYNNYYSSPTLTNCTFSGNTAGDGGGIYCHNSSPAITNCTFSGNSATNYGGGIYNHYDSSPTLTNCTFSGNTAGDGGGIYCQKSSSTITNCTFSGNSATNSGGGIYNNYYSSPTLTNCTFSGNTAGDDGGGIYCHNSSPTITNCTISGNTASDSGGGINCYESSPSLINCTISDNTASDGGGGINCYYNSSPSLINCTISGNSAGNSGGGMLGGVNSVLTNCTFRVNSAQNGGGLYYYGQGHIINCTITGNLASQNGGGIYSRGLSPTITNCTISGNSASNGNALACDSYQQRYPSDVKMTNCILWDGGNEIWNNDKSTISINYSDVQGGWLGEGNIDDDPCFVDEAGGDYHLLQTSPCVDAGDPNYVVGNQTDIDGQPRVMGQRVDMGVDEFFLKLIGVRKPAGGELWTSGSIHEIEWHSDFYEGTVDILFSKDAGENWKAIESDVSNTGSYLWHLPDIADSNQCLIKVVPSPPDSNVVCIESGLFTIHPDSPDPAVTSQWKSLGGDSKRAGLSKDQGPEYGCVKWKFQPDGPIPTSVTISPNGRVHIACEDGKLYTLNSNGSLLWSYDVNSPLISSPTIGPDGTVYVGAENGKLYAIDINGNLRWTHTTAGPVSSSPAVSADGNVYVGSQDGLLYALAPDGSELWSFQTKGPGVLPDGSIFASPSLGADGSVYIAGLYDPNLYALDPNNGSVKWACNFESGGWPFASPVVAQSGTIYQTLLYDSNMYAIEPNDGTITWSVDLADPYSGWFDPNYGDADGWSEPALGPDGTIYVSFDDPYLRAVDPNGTIKWAMPLGTLGGFTLTIGNDGLIYAAGDDGTLRAVDANGWEVARFSSNDWLNYPVIAADNLIIVTDGNDDSFLFTDSNNTVWAISQHGCRDLNFDGAINFNDVALLTAYWLQCTDAQWPCNYEGEQKLLTADVDGDKYVKFPDLALIANLWHGSEKLLAPLPPPPLPGQPTDPNPPDGATEIPPHADLSWTAGPYATEHDVYFGTSNPPPFICTQTAATFALEPMVYLTTYFWRIDEVNAMGKTTGDPWTFTTRNGGR